MKGVLSEKALREVNDKGFVRTGIRLPDSVLARVHETYDRMAPSDSNWGLFHVNALTSSRGFPLRKVYRRARRSYHHVKALAITGKFPPWKLHGRARRAYDKSIFGFSEALPLVLRECLSQGLACHLGDIPLLVGHDIYLEHDRHKKTFGFHHDGFGWDIFYQSGDDLSFYIPLVDLTESSGGRLLVEAHPSRSVLYEDRNDMISRFAAYCRKYQATDDRGLVTRQAVEDSPNRLPIAEEYERLLRERRALPRPTADDMSLIDAARGEVVLFCNKRFHDIEPWKLDVPRAIYIVRCLPLYDFGMAPPATFLNNAPCNRFLLDGCRGTLSPFNAEMDMARAVPVPPEFLAADG